MERDRALALGFFDGVHLGHAALLNTAFRRAQGQNLSAAAISFDTHPDTLVSGAEVPLLGTLDERAELMRELCAIEEVLPVHFDRQMMTMPWDAFVQDYLVRTLRARHVVCGQDFRFGDRGLGDAERLRSLCARLGLGCDVIAQVRLDGSAVSSTRIRRLLLAGDCREAVRLLGHPHRVTGTVLHGRGCGRTLGFPTANLAFRPGVLIPAFGVYRAQVRARGGVFDACVNIGVHPTVGALDSPVLEAWLAGFDGTLYGEEICVELLDRLRPEMTFPSAEALRAQIARDREAVLRARVQA